MEVNTSKAFSPVKNVPAGKSMIARDTRAKKTEVLKRNDNKASRRRFYQKVKI